MMALMLSRRGVFGDFGGEKAAVVLILLCDFIGNSQKDTL
jgi:hypothetical protein